MIAVGTDDLLESSLGFLAALLARSGLQLHAFRQRFGGRRPARRRRWSGTKPGLVAACAHGMSEDCRSADEERLAANIAAASVGAGEAFRKAATTSRLADAPRSKDKALPTRSSVVRNADGIFGLCRAALYMLFAAMRSSRSPCTAARSSCLRSSRSATISPFSMSGRIVIVMSSNLATTSSR